LPFTGNQRVTDISGDGLSVAGYHFLFTLPPELLAYCTAKLNSLGCTPST